MKILLKSGNVTGLEIQRQSSVVMELAIIATRRDKQKIIMQHLILQQKNYVS